MSEFPKFNTVSSEAEGAFSRPISLEDIRRSVEELERLTEDSIIRIVVAPDVLALLSEHVPALPFRVGGSSTWISPSGIPVLSGETLPQGAWAVVRRRGGEEYVAETGNVRTAAKETY